MSDHSRFAPSSLFRTRVCPGWLKESEGIPNEATQDTLDGEASHWVAQQLLTDMKESNGACWRAPDVFIGQIAPNGTVLTEEMVECAEMYALYVKQYVLDWSCVFIEHRVQISAIHENCFGTPDTFTIYEKAGTLVVFDYKFGHRRVEAMLNDQGMAYALGACEELGMTPNDIVIHIYNPRCYYDGAGPVTTWSLTYNRLMSECEVLASACILADDTYPPVTPTPDGCRDCPARTKCTALGREVAELPVVNLTSPERGLVDLGYEKSILDRYQSLLEARLTGINQEMESRMVAGERIPGWKREQKFGHRKWKCPDDEVLALGTLFGCDFRKTDPVTPATADKLLKKNNIDASVINSYSERASSGWTLVQTDRIKINELFGDKT